MTKILRILSVPVLVVAAAISMVGITTVSAQETCDDVVITNTGQGSNNEVTCEGDYQIVIECKNDTQIVIDVDQNSGQDEGSSGSGDATVSQNTTGGSAQSGDSVNVSEIDALIENNNCLDEEEEVVAVTPEPETPAPTEPEAVEEGEVQSETTAPATLADTGETTIAQLALVSSAALLAVIVAGKVGLSAFARK